MIIKPDNSGHWYTVEGSPAHNAGLREVRERGLLPSVTTVLKVWPKDNLQAWKDGQILKAAHENPIGPNETYENWAARVNELSKKVMREAALYGTRVHNQIEDYYKGVPMPNPEPAVSHYIKWSEANVDGLVFSESVLVNKEMGYAGTCDLKVKLKDGRVALLDYKTQRVNGRPNFYDTYLMQLAAYEKCSQADVLISVVINSLEPQPPYIKEWTGDASYSAWLAFVDCFNLWCRSKKYWPGNKQQEGDK